MDERALLAILGAIIYAGADDHTQAGYSPEDAVKKAKAILDQATKVTCEPVA